jgi:4-diphosphocytidyl-2-C-methyl-D-erythritol kinase
MSKQEKEEIALSLGSDTLFCLYGEPAYVTGRGEHLEFLKPIHIPIIYLYPSLIEVSTKTIFANHEIKKADIPFDALVNDYQNQVFDRFIENSYNSLTPTTLKVYPVLKSQVKILKKIDPFVKMTGSGSTFYSILFNPDDELLLKKLLKNPINFIKTQTKA